MKPSVKAQQHQQYYLALLCPAEIDEQIRNWKQGLKKQFGAVAALKSPAHITLIPPFWWPEENEDELLTILEHFSPHSGVVTVTLNGFSHFEKRVLFVAVEQSNSLNELHKQARDYFVVALGKAYKPDQRLFHPHVTLATRDLKPGDFDRAWEYFRKQSFEASFTSHIISLLKLNPGQWKVIAEKAW